MILSFGNGLGHIRAFDCHREGDSAVLVFARAQTLAGPALQLDSAEAVRALVKNSALRP